MPRPRIGITTSLNDGEQRLDRRYVLAVERAGGLPMPVPMLADDDAEVEFLRLLHGLIFTGGPAITEGLQGKLPDDLADTAPERSASDRKLLQVGRNAGLPVLGICYGMQLINASAGGAIFADVEAQMEAALPHSEKRNAPDHEVEIVPDSHLHRMMGTTTIVTNTRHIQAVADVGDGLRVSARAHDGVVEAIESDDGLLIGVQFHPERMGEVGTPLFLDLVARAARFREQLTPAFA